MDRSKKIIQTSIITILVNAVLIVFKMIVGLITGSISIILDAVNNLGDALGSIITIIGTKLAGKKPDQKHPYGHGRIEYISSLLIALIVLFAGVTSLKESILKIIHPEPAVYTKISLIIIAVAIVAKFACGFYVKKTGEKINAQTLVASGSDAFMDSLISLTTLIGAIINMIFGLQLEAFLGVIISLFIIKAGMEIILDTLNSIIGARSDADLTKEIKQFISSIDGVNGAYDLILHNYGPTSYIGSIHVEVNDTMSAPEIHKLTRLIMERVAEEYHILMTVGIYASNTTDASSIQARQEIAAILQNYQEIKQMHGFMIEEARKVMYFDLVILFKADQEAIVASVKDQITKIYPGYQVNIAIDTDFSD